MQNGCQNDLKIHEKSMKIRKKNGKSGFKEFGITLVKGIWDHFKIRALKKPPPGSPHPTNLKEILRIGNLTRMKTKLMVGELQVGELKVG